MRKLIWKKHDPYSSNFEIPEEAMQMHFVFPDQETNRNLYNSFDFWEGHTNFRLTKEVMTTLDAMEGIESLNIITPYRFLISIAQAFSQDEIKENVEKVLGCNISIDDKLLIKLNSLKSKLKPPWLIYVVPNGKICVAEGDDFETNSQIFFEADAACGGLLIKND